MPFVNIKSAKPSWSKEEKSELIKDITELLSTKYSKNKERVMVVIDEYDADSVGVGGLSVEEIKKKSK